MKIFVLGASHTGKTPFAHRVSEAFAIPVVAASAWVRAKFPAGAPVAEMTSYAIAQLRAEPAISVDHLRARITDPCVIEGVRNPYDFVHCFDPREDVAVFLRPANSTTPTAFERGLDVIRAYLDWLASAELLGRRVIDIEFAEFGEPGAAREGTLELAIERFIAEIEVTPSPQPQRVHATIPPLRTHVRAEYLFGMDPARVGELRPCTAFSIASYQNSVPTFQILLDDGAVFSYLPPSALIDPARAREPTLDLEDLVYRDCKTTLISVHDFDALHGSVLAYFKRKDLWLGGTYLFTIDWYAGNEMLHALALDNGQYALLPSHKVKFGDHPPGFEPYKKIRREWTVSVD